MPAVVRRGAASRTGGMVDLNDVVVVTAVVVVVVIVRISVLEATLPADTPA